MNASFSKVLNRALFVTDTLYGSLGNRFGLVYDTLNLTVIEASFAYQLNEKLKIDALGRFNSYEMMHEARAWNLPQVQFLIRGHYNLYDKFIVKIIQLYYNDNYKIYQSIKEENITDLVSI
mgnify:CR=1 FL=1